MDEQTAWKRLRRRDEQALAWLIDRYAAYVAAIAFQILGTSTAVSDLEEVSADTFFTLWTNAGQVAEGKVKAYLGAVARNKSRERLRRVGKELPLEGDVLELSCEGPEHTLTEQEQARFLREAILSMKAPDREIFLRYYYYCQPVAAIAEALALHPAAVKTRLHRGRKTLRERLIKGGYFVEDSDI